MVDVIGDVVIPKELRLPVISDGTSSIMAIDGMIGYDATNKKVLFFNGTAWETVTSE